MRRPLVVLTLVAGFLHGWGLFRGGTHYYYSAAVRSMSTNWSAFAFGAVDPASSMTVDKLPGGLWIQALFVRVLGFHSWVLLLPGALAATATVPLLFAAVRRWAGTRAGVIAAVVLLVSPVVFVTARVNLVDPLLVLCLVAAAYAMTRALEDHRWRWVAVAGVLVGAGFQIKMIEAWVVLPALVAACLAGSGPRGWRATVLGGTATVVSLGWLVVAGFIPRGERPHVDGSRDDSWWEMVFGYNGLGRGLAGGGSPLSATAAPYGGAPGPLRLVDDQLGGQAGWLVPLALVLLAACWWTRRDDPLWTLWGGWLLTAALVLSFLPGLHPYYATLLAPALAAVVGAGVPVAWAWWRDRSSLRWVLPLGGVLSAAGAVVVVTRAGGPGWLVGVVTVVVLGLVLGGPRREVAAAGTVVLLAGPVAWIAITPAVPPNSMHTANPVAGPQTAVAVFGVADPRITLARILGVPPTGPVPAIDAPLPGSDVDPDLLHHLQARRTGERFLFATGDASTASPYLAAGYSVLPMGGFTGFSPYPELSEVAGLVQGGQLRFLYLTAVPGLPGVLGERAAWARSHCAPVPLRTPGGMTLFDCAGASWHGRSRS
ncbi:glycosyltransferase family 39 protein [Amycolatopsis sp. NPDC024027]|uniref:ArnT family glycosyltransferase n=1 Tax=Amycolatopsis sp. NPDC024027 TaxID=3154327 RepID=UPI0033D093D1